MKASITARLLHVSAALGVTSVIVLGDWLPPKTGGNVTCDEHNENIGTLSVSSSGNVLNYNDNPNTDHDPNTSAAWVKDQSSGGYTNGQGHWVYFYYVGDNTYIWVKQTAQGGYLDSGTYSPINGNPPTP